jgi:hypothetical protein
MIYVFASGEYSDYSAEFDSAMTGPDNVDWGALDREYRLDRFRKEKHIYDYIAWLLERPEFTPVRVSEVYCYWSTFRPRDTQANDSNWKTPQASGE